MPVFGVKPEETPVRDGPDGFGPLYIRGPATPVAIIDPLGAKIAILNPQAETITCSLS
jgi:hypothetical protein